MDDATRAVVALSAAVGAGRRDALLDAMDRALEAAPPRAVEEALLQTYLFLGFPAALNALSLWRRRSGSHPQSGDGEDDWHDWRERGPAVCGAVYGEHYPALRRAMDAIHPELGEWAVVEGYGKVLGRPGLGLRARELCIVAMLATQDASRQLFAHLRGALNVGATPEDVGEALDLAGAVAAEQRSAQAAATWQKVRARLGLEPRSGDVR